MSPRPYRLGQRQAAIEQTRGRIIEATRELLMENDGFSRFSIDLVARRADVARMTVYHQFGSRVGLLEALCDTLAANGKMESLGGAFQLADPFEALKRYIAVFGHFYDTDRLVTRRLRAVATLDSEFGQIISERDSWRQKGLTVLIQRVHEQRPFPSAEAVAETIAVMLTLTSFESFDTLAGPERSLEEVAPLIQRLALATLDMAYKS
ncbi:TetR/AcrR family transcriptional regulator [Ktedonospora formicarum]|uniref:HTH tetR-type domain-containing protein n=1 Tax=Ktedonospora formicarum TaxID=2778364 RepID=A0A8J3IB45_9CHLR|nr:TetR/AcrR family transcriptional regulator [Ktedonospora formicarum]GHO48084.1 hypothetical protein KSX_62470 [Ktedonospora formicarum]